MDLSAVLLSVWQSVLVSLPLGHTQGQIWRWWRVWHRDVRQGWLIISRFRVLPASSGVLLMLLCGHTRP